MDGFKVDVNPKVGSLLGIPISETQVTLLICSVILILFAVIFRFVLFPKFTQRPGKFQNIIETIIQGSRGMAEKNIGEKCVMLKGYSFSMLCIIGVSSLLELLSFRGPATDFNFAFSIAVMSLIIITGYGIKYKGLLGYQASLGKPMAFMWPFKALSQITIPVSLSCRLFGNMFASMVVMEIIYHAMGYFAVGIPAVLSVYFNLFDVGIQAYIFVLLTQIFTGEAIEEPEEEPKKRKKRNKLAAPAKSAGEAVA